MSTPKHSAPAVLDPPTLDDTASPITQVAAHLATLAIPEEKKNITLITKPKAAAAPAPKPKAAAAFKPEPKPAPKPKAAPAPKPKAAAPNTSEAVLAFPAPAPAPPAPAPLPAAPAPEAKKPKKPIIPVHDKLDAIVRDAGHPVVDAEPTIIPESCRNKTVVSTVDAKKKLKELANALVLCGIPKSQTTGTHATSRRSKFQQKTHAERTPLDEDIDLLDGQIIALSKQYDLSVEFSLAVASSRNTNSEEDQVLRQALVQDPARPIGSKAIKRVKNTLNRASARTKKAKAAKRRKHENLKRQLEDEMAEAAAEEAKAAEKEEEEEEEESDEDSSSDYMDEQ